MMINNFSSIFITSKESIIKFFIKWLYDVDLKLIKYISLLSFFSILIMSSASPAIASRINVSSSFFLTKHIFFISIGFILMLLISILNLDVIEKIIYFLTFIIIFSLFYLLFFGLSIKGAKRWLQIGSLTLQPSELLKPFFLYVNAQLLSKRSFQQKKYFFISLFFLMIVISCCILQPDFGTSFVYIFIWGVQIFVSGFPYYIICIIAIIAICMFGVGHFFFDHFRYRIYLFLHSSGKEEQYQIKKATEAIQNGGYFGNGIGNGEIKYQLPDCHTDYIFSLIFEEFGLIIAILFIIYMMFLVLHIIFLARYEIKYNTMRKNFIFGVAGMLVMQIFVNIGVNLKILPSKGMTLPFISYGGSSMIANFISIGLILAFSRKKYRFKSLYIKHLSVNNI